MSRCERFLFSALLFLLVWSSYLGGLFENFLFAEEKLKIHLLSDSHQQKSDEPLPAPIYTITPDSSEIKVDGVLDEEAWENAAIMKLPYEWLPGDNVPPPVETECLVSFDKKNFYVAFRCYDPDPSQIRAHLMDRDATDTLIQDDHVVILVDTFNDERRGFQFRVNPLGVQADASFSESEGSEDFSWDAIWSSAGKITDWGYAIEIAIPFNQLRFPRTSDMQTWGFSAERSYPRNVRHRISSHRRDRNIQCLLCQVNKIIGIQGVSPGLNLEFVPTLTSNRTDRRKDFPEGPMQQGKVEPGPGITARWGITPNLILNATANPDFSHVEADVAQLEVNIKFAIWYPEKRSFFLEGADFFLTPFEAVFTRTVADPAGGLKLTGKVGKNVFGVFAASDRINNLLFPSNQASLSTSEDQDVLSGVLRYRRDIGQSSTLGILYTGRRAEGYYNHVAGFDGFFRLTRTKSMRFQFLHSETKYPEEISHAFGQSLASFGGDAFTAEFSHMSRNWRYSSSYSDLSPNFRADYGYIPRVDIRRITGLFGPVFWGKLGDWFTQLNFGIHGEVTYDHDGELTDRRLSPYIMYHGPLQSRIMIEYSQNREFYRDELYDLDQLRIFSEIKPAGGLRFNLVGQFGESIDYQNVRKANGLDLIPSAELSLGRHVNINLQLAFQRLTLEGSEIFRANLTQVRLIYNFSVRAFVRAIVQYLDVSRNPELYLFPVLLKTSTIFTQFLFSYKLNPQTVLFIGYSDDYLGMTGVDITQTDRTFFVKIGYAWTR